ncbi:MAG TPA: hypothetical protein IGS17_13045 [Oscillatoriales cyanobacterium M59_W2019_021]|nr:hypothetical protein [Oscillatoriales cyanobacterium M4454_W2019_049]HIK51830.1 hypothetical protein [Oscillatoriales cyanobacterium M59_W2019_021]
MSLNTSEAIAQTRLLLALWDMTTSPETAIVKKSELLNRVKKKNEKSQDFQPLLDALEEKGAIERRTEKRTALVSLQESGVQLLATGLRNSEFEYTSNVGKKDANALLKWIRQMGGLASGSVGTVQAIDSYDEFKAEVLNLFEKLDKGYNYIGLVPIWHLRREMGERVDRLQFNDWMMEMQAEKLFYLQSGEARGATDEQKRDSIYSDIRGLLFYASQPS